MYSGFLLHNLTIDNDNDGLSLSISKTPCYFEDNISAPIKWCAILWSVVINSIFFLRW